MNFSFYFDRIFAENEAGGERYRLLFEQLGNFGCERGKGISSITVGVLMVLVYALGLACVWMYECDECEACYERAREEFVRLLGEDHAKSVGATFSLLVQTTRGDERIAELRALWERRVSRSQSHALVLRNHSRLHVCFLQW